MSTVIPGAVGNSLIAGNTAGSLAGMDRDAFLASLLPSAADLDAVAEEQSIRAATSVPHTEKVLQSAAVVLKDT